MRDRWRENEARRAGGLALIAAGAIAASAQAQATDPPQPPPSPIIVTASRLDDSAGIVTIPHDAIANHSPITLIDVLDGAPGVRAVSTGGPGGTSFLSIRGGQPNFTVVLLDGIRLTDPTNGAGAGFDLSLIDPGLVDHLAISRMAGSAIHGSDALAGVVEIITRDPLAGAPKATATAWLDNRYGEAISASLAGGWGSGGLLGGAGRADSGNGDPAGTLRRDQAMVRLTQRLAGLRVDAEGLYATRHATNYPEDSGGPQLAVNRQREASAGDLWVGAVTARGTGDGAVIPHAGLDWSVQHSDTATPAIAPGVLSGVPAITALDRYGRLDGVADLTLRHGRLTAVLGAEVLHETGQSAGTIQLGFVLPQHFALSRTTHSGFAEIGVKPAASLKLDAAARYDRLLGGDGDLTGQGTLDWQPNAAGPALFARIGSGYKRPTLYALGNPLIGNAALHPERSRSIEGGVRWQHRTAQLVLTLFDSQFRDLIDFDPVRFRLVNRDRVRSRGVEAEVGIALGGGWSLAGTLTWLALASPTPLVDRPAWNGQARLNWARGRWQAGATLHGNSGFADSSIPTGAVMLGGHLAADAAARFRLTRHASLGLAGLNLTGQRSPTAVGTPPPGRSVRLIVTVD